MQALTPRQHLEQNTIDKQTSRTNRTAAAPRTHANKLKTKSEIKAFSKIDITFFYFLPFYFIPAFFVFLSRFILCLMQVHVYVYNHKRVHVSDLVQLSYW